MNYVIDGHNLIGKIDGISLSDPDDEAKLVLRLLNWAAVGKNRRVIVVFDGGVPGSQWAKVRSEMVKPVFVPKGRTADDWIITFMYNIKDRKSFQIVTSDNAILKQADNRRIPTMKSEDFARDMAAERNRFSDIAEPDEQETVRPLMKAEQVDAWIQMFGGEPDLEIKPYQPKPAAPEPVPQPTRPTKRTESREGMLSQDEVSEWLQLFGGEREIISVHETSIRAKRAPGAQTQEKKVVREGSGPAVDDDSLLTQDDMDLWHSLFGDE